MWYFQTYVVMQIVLKCLELYHLLLKVSWKKFLLLWGTLLSRKLCNGLYESKNLRCNVNSVEIMSGSIPEIQVLFFFQCLSKYLLGYLVVQTFGIEWSVKKKKLDYLTKFCGLWLTFITWQNIFLSSFIFPNKNSIEFSSVHAFYYYMPLRHDDNS